MNRYISKLCLSVGFSVLAVLFFVSSCTPKFSQLTIDKTDAIKGKTEGFFCQDRGTNCAPMRISNLRKLLFRP